MASDLKSWWVVCPCPFLCHKQQDSDEVKPKGNGASDNLSVLQLWEPRQHHRQKTVISLDGSESSDWALTPNDTEVLYGLAILDYND